MADPDPRVDALIDDVVLKMQIDHATRPLRTRLAESPLPVPAPAPALPQESSFHSVWMQASSVTDDAAVAHATAESAEMAVLEPLARLRRTWLDTGRGADLGRWLSLNDTYQHCPLCLRVYDDTATATVPCEHMSYCRECWHSLAADDARKRLCYRCGGDCVHIPV